MGVRVYGYSDVRAYGFGGLWMSRCMSIRVCGRQLDVRAGVRALSFLYKNNVTRELNYFSIIFFARVRGWIRPRNEASISWTKEGRLS